MCVLTIVLIEEFIAAARCGLLLVSLEIASGLVKRR